MTARTGRQTPTSSVIIPYKQTKGQEAIDLYNSGKNKAQEWQELMMYDIMAVDDDGLWVHQKFGYEIPRRNGKGEIAEMRELWGLINGQKGLHTAHRVNTSSSAAKRLASQLDSMGFAEIQRPKKDTEYEKGYIFSKQKGVEHIELLGHGKGYCDFRTRSNAGGLGEGFDYIVIDEAQEYTDAQNSTLQYCVTDSKNPQMLFCGTPPTAVSSGTQFVKMRDEVLKGRSVASGWAEWSVEKMTDPNDIDAWYDTNPSLGYVLTERNIIAEDKTDAIDFNIQRLGLWLRYNQKSAISENEWNRLRADTLPKLNSKLYVGIRYGTNNEHASMSIAVKTKDGKVFVECIGCHKVKEGNAWILDFLRNADVEAVCVDGKANQTILQEQMRESGLKSPVFPSVNDVIVAANMFEQAIENGSICHCGQPSLTQSVTNCEHRAIGSNGGFGYKSIKDGSEISLLESTMLAFWLCSTSKEKKKQRVSC